MKIIKILLLLSLLFNITHAVVITMEEGCHHDTVTKYRMVQNSDDGCGALCDIDHLFHFIAILTTTNMYFGTFAHNKKAAQEFALYLPPFKETTTKPPIV